MNEMYCPVEIISLNNVVSIFIATIMNAYLIIFIVNNDVQIMQIVFYVIN